MLNLVDAAVGLDDIGEWQGLYGGGFYLISRVLAPV